ncbi:MAG: hypothetical protein GC180_04930 [Bacteroidetes bacterium]|nr:hypothetical protein [Bacteroidota bacterium]
MKIFNLNVITLVTLAMWILSSCHKNDKKENPQPSTDATINFEFQAVGDLDYETLKLGQVYSTSKGDSVTFDFLNWWVSDITFTAEDGSEWNEAKNYRLLRRDDKKERETFSVNIPAGKYKSVRFTVGVDSNHNASLDSLVGELSPTVGMSWTWQTGYIFLKTEGTFYNSDSMAYTPFQYHIGTNANYKIVTIDFPVATDVNGGSSYELHILLHALNLFTDPNAMDLKTYPYLLVGPPAQTAKVAENYSQAFSLHHFEEL